MALGFTPLAEIYGANAALLNERLIDWRHIDAAGLQSDQLQLTLDTQGLEGLPSLGGRIGLRVGYRESGMVDKGQFIISRRTPYLFPMRLVLIATAAPFKELDETGFVMRRSASYGPITLGALFRQLTTRHGFSPRVAPELDGLMIEHIDQCNETDMGFLTRLAEFYKAVTKPVDGLYVLARRGQVKSLSGKALPEVRLSVTTDNRPGDQAFISAKVDEESRSKKQGCKVIWWDSADGKKREVQVGNKPFTTLTGCRNEQEAWALAAGEMGRQEREARKIHIDCPGDPALTAEGLLLLDASWPGFMQGRWSIDKVTSSGSQANSYRCSIEASCLAQKA